MLKTLRTRRKPVSSRKTQSSKPTNKGLGITHANPKTKQPTDWWQLGFDADGIKIAREYMRSTGVKSGDPDLSLPWMKAFLGSDDAEARRQGHFEIKVIKTCVPLETAPIETDFDVDSPRRRGLLDADSLEPYCESNPVQYEEAVVDRVRESGPRFWEAHPELVNELAVMLDRPPYEIAAVTQLGSEKEVKAFFDRITRKCTEPIFSPYGVFSPLSSCEHDRLAGDKFDDSSYCPICHRTAEDNGQWRPKVYSGHGQRGGHEQAKISVEMVVEARWRAVCRAHADAEALPSRWAANTHDLAKEAAIELIPWLFDESLKKLRSDLKYPNRPALELEQFRSDLVKDAGQANFTGRHCIPPRLAAGAEEPYRLECRMWREIQRDGRSDRSTELARGGHH